MAEAIAAVAVVSSIVAIIQIADRVIGLCKVYIETVRDAPSDLRAVLIETSTMKTILENVQFLISCNNGSSMMLDGLTGAEGPIEGCRSAIAKIEGLFPPIYAQGPRGGRTKRQKVEASLAALAWPLKENKARKLVEEVVRYKTTINLALTAESTHDIKDIKSKTTMIYEILSENQRQKVYDWLQVTDPSPLHHRACKQYEPGTGDWMLRSPEWANWLERKTRCVWVYGIPGAGKTVLASHLIEKIKQYCGDSTTKKYAYIYYYCYFGHNQDEAAPFLRWTINRLCCEADLIPTCLYQLYKHGGQPSLVELLHALAAILEVFDNIYIVTDAIDESMPRDDLLSVLRDLATDSRFQKVQLLSTSRQYIDIENIMEQISVSVSMFNPLLIDDIRLYVRSQLHTNPKFKHWLLPLQEEVVDALSAGAKGMFCWAACQIDALRRLKGESNVVRNALANLPKTLDETYERIFLGIADEDRIFVQYALKWIYYHDELHGKSISCSILLQAIEKSTSESITSGRDYSYNEELLRELCGCLITVVPEDRSGRFQTDSDAKTRVVSSAHYTVWEYLDSARILSSSTTFFAVIKEKTNIECTRTIILEVLDIQPNERWEWKTASINSSDIVDALEEDFNSYCVLSSILSLRRCGVEISKEDDLRALAFNLLDPSKPHYQYFEAAARKINDSADAFFQFSDTYTDYFWNITWEPPLQGGDARILVSLLKWDENLNLAKMFLEKTDKQEVLQTQLDLYIETLDITEHGFETYRVQGSIIELFAQLSRDEPQNFRMLLEVGEEFWDPSIVLISFAGSHNHDIKYNCKDYCPLLKLLELGANANVLGYRVTPLQMAVTSWDFEGVKALLEAGADPNGIGDRGGISWEKETLLGRFNHLHGHSPLFICREFKCIRKDDNEQVERLEARAKIDAILLQYGAKALGPTTSVVMRYSPNARQQPTLEVL